MNESIWSPNGKKIGSVRSTGSQKSNVYDGQNKRVGTVSQNGTYDLAGKRVADKPMPGLLMNRNDKQKR
jgi:hypothetical protein